MDPETADPAHVTRADHRGAATSLRIIQIRVSNQARSTVMHGSKSEMSDDDELVKIFFSLESEDDWPPVTVENVWARPTDEPHQYVIENTPFFIHAATLGDIVLAERRPTMDKSDAEKLWFHGRVRWGGNALIRLIVRKKEAEVEIVTWLRQNGCICEGFDRFAMIAVSVPASADQKVVQEYLLQREEAGDVHVEEAILRE